MSGITSGWRVTKVWAQSEKSLGTSAMSVPACAMKREQSLSIRVTSATGVPSPSRAISATSSKSGSPPPPKAQSARAASARAASFTGMGKGLSSVTALLLLDAGGSWHADPCHRVERRPPGSGMRRAAPRRAPIGRGRAARRGPVSRAGPRRRRAATTSRGPLAQERRAGLADVGQAARGGRRGRSGKPEGAAPAPVVVVPMAGPAAARGRLAERRRGPPAPLRHGGMPGRAARSRSTQTRARAAADRPRRRGARGALRPAYCSSQTCSSCISRVWCFS